MDVSPASAAAKSSRAAVARRRNESRQVMWGDRRASEEPRVHRAVEVIFICHSRWRGQEIRDPQKVASEKNLNRRVHAVAL